MKIFNWKMNPSTLKEALELASCSDEKDVVVCAPFVFLSKIKLKKAKLGAQDSFHKEKGAFTGEVSCKMLKNLGVEYVILGHSERKEKDQEVNLKIKACLKNNLKPIVCLDERLRIERLKGVKNAIIAYEPVSSIGTNNPCPIKKALKVRDLIRKKMKDSKILYGGSINSSNYLKYQEVFDGLLIGGASLDKKEIKKILEK